MKKSIEVKGTIKVDKKGMSNVRCGESCGHMGIACKAVTASQQQEMTETVVIVDKLKW